jgi:hypothetical protein
MKNVLFAITLCGFVPSSAFAQRATADSVDVPFAFVHNEIVLQAMINQKGPFAMLLDTGTDPSVIDFVAARNLGLERQGAGVADPRPYMLKLARIAVGSLVAPNVAAAATDLSPMRERFGSQLDGVLGHSFLNRRIVQIDYPKSVVRFYSVSPIGSANADGPGFAKMRFRYDDDVLLDGVRVNGHLVTGTLDTGSDGTFKFTPKAVVDLGLAEDVRNAKPALSAGYAGVRNNFEGRLTSSIALGAIRVDMPLVTFFGKDSGLDQKPWGVNIGNAFLKDYVVTIDYSGKVVVFQRP